MLVQLLTLQELGSLDEEKNSNGENWAGWDSSGEMDYLVEAPIDIRNLPIDRDGDILVPRKEEHCEPWYISPLMLTSESQPIYQELLLKHKFKG